MACRKSSSNSNIYSNTGLPQETRKIWNRQPNLPSKGIRKEKQTKPKVSRREEIIKIREEINKKDPKKQQKRTMKARPVI